MKTLGKVLREKRTAHRRELSTKIKPLLFVEQLKGRTIFGMDRKGNRVESKELSSFGIAVHRMGIVEITFHRDDSRHLKNMFPSEAEMLVKKGKQEKKEVTIITDVYRAVRLFRHIIEGYRKELRRTKMIGEAERINAFLSEKCKTISDEEIGKTIERINALIELVRKKNSASKIVSAEKLEMAVNILEGALGADRHVKARRAGGASACMVAFRNRYERWRLEIILKRRGLAHLKEYSLRAERDRRMHGLIRSWASTIQNGNPYAIRNLWIGDKKIISILEKLTPGNVKETISELEKKKIISKQAGDFLESAQELVGEGKMLEAYYELRGMYFFLCSNKPWYIAKQIEKTDDFYLVEGEKGKTFIEYLRTGAELFEKKVFDRAQHCFEKSLEILGKKVVEE